MILCPNYECCRQSDQGLLQHIPWAHLHCVRRRLPGGALSGVLGVCCYWLVQAAFQYRPQEVCWEILYTAWVCMVGDKLVCSLLVLDSIVHGKAHS